MIRLRDGSLWVVKGCHHPLDGVVAVIRVFEGRRVKRLGEAYEIMGRYYRHYMRFLSEFGKVVPVVPREEVSEYVRGAESREVLREGLSRLHAATLEFIDLLSGYGLKCGLSGSLLGGYYTAGSDIDLVCAEGRVSSYEVLRALREEGVTESLSPTEALEEVLVVGELIPSEPHARILTRKLTQGKFKGIKYTLRILDCGEERGLLGPYDVNREEHVLIKLTNTTHKTPAVYEVSVLRPRIPYEKAYLISYRARLTELPQETLIAGKGLTHSRLDEGLLIIDFDAPNTTIEFMSY